MALVKFIQGTAADYAALESKDTNTLYFLTDVKQIRKGDELYSGGVYEAVSSYPTTGVVNTLYVNTSDGSVQYWNGTGYQEVVKPTTTAISGSGTNLEFPTSKAVVDYVTAKIQAIDYSGVTSRIDTLESEMDAVQADLETKADAATTLAGYGITDAYTKTEADTAIATAVANADHLKREIVASLPAVADADANTIYMVSDSGSSSDAGSATSSYTEYMLINGAFERIGTSDVDLTDYAKTADVTSAIATAKAEAATDATTKADAALANAKTYADGLASNYATAAQGALADTALQASDIATGSTNGTIAVDGTDVAVKGLGTAAYAATSDFDAAGAASTAKSEAIAAAKTETETQVAAAKTALVGTATDTADSDTIKGAKAYADSVAASSASDAVADLDVTDAAVTNQYVSTVSQTDGKIAVTRETLPVYSVTAATGDSNGQVKISVNGTATNVDVKGLGSAAYTESTAYDASGAADTALTNAKAYTDEQITSALTWGTL